MNKTNDQEEMMKELAAQLRRPHDANGLEVALNMADNNRGMIRHAIDMLELRDDHTVLEIGHGNGAHLNYLFSKAFNLFYHGLEISSLMHEEASRLNQQLLNDQTAITFGLYDGKKLPFKDETFDRIFTVNTIYFWEDPEALLQEMFRVLKPGGKLGITLALDKFMKQLPFTKYGFELYHLEKLKELFGTTPFSIDDIIDQRETVVSKAGDKVERDFSTVILIKTDLL